ncbi:uncharacterized protein N7446_005561 [Penicillium canescens]|uniref:Aminoglycoside phosphotransferase domain-containing protein n=1 Tax=Penicillium canescens TaxID=5083 RepID=A0AAD6IIM4_PENCN|nr:uncharacterized protein N7446_005561 [Penicillium canescens]KAJ6050201.1 hypothetical protein N7444_006917 [Penicillium canescens]KAJ6050933.1 hypothetical protein N7460_001467 [Penicillium canescens]KAJ6061441.1 hypothetical protein N7446_005561 [Penicillium canescens]
MGMWSCDIENCGKTSDEKNYDPAAVRAEQEEVAKLLAKINVAALTSRASYLRNGIGCSILQKLQYDPSTRNSVMGGMNYHVEISFEDGISWLARIRRFNVTSPPLKLQEFIMRSEVATLEFLRETKIPAPKVFDFCLDEANPVGVRYILMEKMPGKSLSWSDATKEQRMKVIDQLADIYVELQAHPFAMMGSLDKIGSKFVIGPFARESLADFGKSGLEMLGPFSSLEEYYSAHIELILDLIVRQEAYANRPVDAFLIHLYLQENILAILPDASLDDGKFYLKHADEKGDQILVDDQFRITGIIDWEWAHTGPKSAVFNSPIVLLPLAEFYEGGNCLGGEELAFSHLLETKGHPDLGDIVKKGRLLHRLQFCCGYDLPDWNGYKDIFMGLVRALRNDGDSNILDYETWKAEAMERYRSDHRLKGLCSLQM